MLQGEHSSILSTFIKLQFVIVIVVLSIFEWPLKTGFTVAEHSHKDFDIQSHSIVAHPSLKSDITVMCIKDTIHMFIVK